MTDQPTSARDDLAARLPGVYVEVASTLDLANRPHMFVQINLAPDQAAALVEEITEGRKAREQVEAVRALHTGVFGWCGCDMRYPCPTRRALDGTDSGTTT